MTLSLFLCLLTPNLIDDVQQHVLRGVELANKGDFKAALPELDVALRLDPKNQAALRFRAGVHVELGEYDRAIADASVAIQLDPKRADAGYDVRADAYYRQKEYAKAVKDLDEAIRFDPWSVRVLSNRAWIAATCPDARFRDGRLAFEYARRVCEKTDWKYAYALGCYAAASAETGRFEEAVKWQKRALEDEQYLKRYAEKGRDMLRLFEQKKPYREQDPFGQKK